MTFTCFWYTPASPFLSLLNAASIPSCDKTCQNVLTWNSPHRFDTDTNMTTVNSRRIRIFHHIQVGSIGGWAGGGRWLANEDINVMGNTPPTPNLQPQTSNLSQ